MGRVITEFTISLDGFIAGPNDEIDRIFGWYGSGDTEFRVPSSPMKFKVSRASAELLKESWGNLGAIVTGRRDFDVSDAYGGVSPLGVPMFIVTHNIPQEWAKEGSPFTFVPEGIERALALAKASAGDKNVGVGGTQIVQQCLQAGLIDEIHLHLVPVLLGAGIRLFNHLEHENIALEKILVIDAPDVTHLRYRVVK